MSIFIALLAVFEIEIMKKHFFLLLLFSMVGQAQFHVDGIIKEATTQKPLPFASINIEGVNYSISDVDGKFHLTSKEKINRFTISYIGFTSVTIEVEEQKKFYNILLQSKTNDLSEVSVSNKNLALAMIQKVIQNKAQNNPQQQLKSFECKSYNKLLITANPDSIDGRVDSLFIQKSIGKKFVKVDSSDYKFKKIISRQHLFQTEKVSQFQFNEKGFKETIIGTRMAGFKSPIYEILAFNLQSFSIYDKQYELFETKYKSPISDHATSDYRFKILDSTFIQGRKTHMIYFKNKKKSKEAGLEGVLYIDTENYAVAKAIMRIKVAIGIAQAF